MLGWILLEILSVVLAYYLFRGLYVYIMAVICYGRQGVILVYRPLWTMFMYMEHERKKNGDSLAQMKALISKKPNAKMIVQCYLFLVIQTVIDSEYINKLTRQFIPNIEKMRFIFHQYGQKSLLFSQYQAWKNSRKIISSVFRFQNLKMEAVYVQKVVKQEINNLEAKRVNLVELGMLIAGRIVIHSLVGQEFQKLMFGKLTALEQVMEIGRTFITLTMKPINIFRQFILGLDTPPQWAYNQQEKDFIARAVTFRSRCADYIRAEYGKYKSQHSVSSKFLQAYFKEPDCEKYFEEIPQQFSLFMFAGQDTTGNWIQQCIVKLGEHPEYQQLILDQLAKTKELSEVTSLNNFIAEVNRLYSPVRNIIIRKVIKSFRIDGFKFKEGTFVTAGIGLAMSNPKYFQDPAKFDPQRWNSKQEDSHSYLPFSAGPKNCIGQHLAKMQVRQTIASLLEMYRFQRTQQTGTMSSVDALNYHQTNNYLVRFVKR